MRILHIFKFHISCICQKCIKCKPVYYTGGKICVNCVGFAGCFNGQIND